DLAHRAPDTPGTPRCVPGRPEGRAQLGRLPAGRADLQAEHGYRVLLSLRSGKGDGHPHRSPFTSSATMSAAVRPAASAARPTHDRGSPSTPVELVSPS